MTCLFGIHSDIYAEYAQVCPGETEHVSQIYKKRVDITS